MLITIVCKGCGKRKRRPFHPGARVKYCDAACRNRYNVKKSREKIKKARGARRPE
jgi:hypothetical protein